MNSTDAGVKTRAEEQVAARYVAQGYQVEHGVPLDGLPVAADLIARRGDETVLIEVRRALPPSSAPSLQTLAHYATTHGWRFTIVVAGGATPGEFEVLPREKVLQLIRDAQQIDPSSWIAPLAASAAFEAAARHVLVRTPRRALPNAGALPSLQALASGGLVTPVEEQTLMRLVSLRNRAAHGATNTPDGDAVRQALSISEALLDRDHETAA